MDKPTILFVGPYPPPIHGEGLAFKTAYDGYEGKKYLVSKNLVAKPGAVKILLTMVGMVQMVWVFCSKKFDQVYFSSNISNYGSIFDIETVFLANLFGKKKIISHLHGMHFKDFYRRQSGIFKKILKWTYSKVDTSIVPFSQIEDQFEDFPEMKLEVVHNFYDQDLEAIESKTKKEEVTLLFLSNFISRKGILEVLAAFEVLGKRYPSLKLVIAGGMDQDEAMSKKEMEQAFFDRYHHLRDVLRLPVEYLGPVNGQQKTEILQESEFFLLPTYCASELFPMAIMDGLRAGCIIITTKHNFIEDYISAKNGRLVAPKSSEEIVSAVEYYLEAPENMEPIPTYNIAHAKSHYAPKKYVENMNRVLAGI